jgi:hypothetical protein
LSPHNLFLSGDIRCRSGRCTRSSTPQGDDGALHLLFLGFSSFPVSQIKPNESEDAASEGHRYPWKQVVHYSGFPSNIVPIHKRPNAKMVTNANAHQSNLFCNEASNGYRTNIRTAASRMKSPTSCDGSLRSATAAFYSIFFQPSVWFATSFSQNLPQISGKR